MAGKDSSVMACFISEIVSHGSEIIVRLPKPWRRGPTLRAKHDNIGHKHPNYMKDHKDKQLACPLCKGRKFQEEEGRLESKWGQTEHKVDMLVCKKCKYILLFNKGRTWIVME